MTLGDLVSMLSGVVNQSVRGANQWVLGKLHEPPPSAADFQSSGIYSPENLAMAITPMGMGAIKAYHGSPHLFDKFDMSKIGTGEGAQAYGHGLYFAERPGVAASYRDALSNDNLGGHYVINGTEEVTGNTPRGFAAAAVRSASSAARFEENLKAYQDYAAKNPNDTWAPQVVENMMQLKDAQVTMRPAGNLYETSLRWSDPAREAADPLGAQHFLQWDRPLNEQPIYQQLKDTIPYQQMPHGSKSGADLYQNISGKIDAANALQQAGIPGIRYLDAGSRGAGEGTANYVLFDDALAQILSRNGMAP